jgi:hypothetical protein
MRHADVRERERRLKSEAKNYVSEANPAVGWGPDGFAVWAGRARALPAERERRKTEREK